MKLKIKTIKGTEKGSIELPKQFNENVRPDIINKAFKVFRSHNFQRYGSNPKAGLKVSAYLSKRRHKYRGAYGIGWSRTPRKIVSRRGTRINYVGAEVPQTVGGRRAHPPKSEKNPKLNINKKEKRMAIRSAISSTLNQDLLKIKNYNFPKDYPFVIEDSIEKTNKTKELKKILDKLNIENSYKRKIRAGIGKLRGRKYRRKKGPLFVVSNNCNLSKAAKNLNAEVIPVKNLNIGMLAPGGQPGRVVFFTESAIKIMKEQGLFLNKKTTKEVNQ
jgi:large subunit ribosomal protein L4e